jgi:surface antigen
VTGDGPEKFIFIRGIAVGRFSTIVKGMFFLNRAMKTNFFAFRWTKAVAWAAALAATMLTGCYTPQGEPDYTATGALTGGAFGAASGAIIGSASHSAGEGALIGAAAGTILGGLIGHSADQAQAARLRQEYPQTYNRALTGTPLSLADVEAMSKAGIADDTIIAQIKNSHTIFHLNATDIIDLHAQGVSKKVIDYMINTPGLITRAATSVVVPEPPPPPPPVEPVVPMPGPGYVWTGGEWVWNNGWFWSAGYWALPPGPGYVWVRGRWYHGPRGYIRRGGHWKR